jgi:putative spermidine/putrescine transport system substrate-binding protein
MSTVRRGHVVLAAFAVATTLAACGGSSPTGGGTDGGNTVVVTDGGGSYHDSQVRTTYEPCTEETGLDITSTSYDYTIGPIRAQVNGAKEWDVVSIGNPMAPELEEELLQPIDYDVVDQPGLPDEAKLKYQVLYVYFAWVPTYRTDSYPTASYPQQPATWADVWDVEKFPGGRGLLNYPIGTLEIALMADGVPYDDLYPLDVERALTKLDELRQSTDVVWYNSGAEQAQQISNGIVDMSAAWNGRITQVKEEGVPAEFTMNQALLQGTSWGVLKTAPNPEGAMRFIQCATSPEVAAQDTIDFAGNAPANLDAFEHIPDDVAASVPSNPEFADTVAGTVDWLWWGENFDQIYERWQEWYTE